jgi:hypothetical protein
MVIEAANDEERMTKMANASMRDIFKRKIFIDKYSWAVPTYHAIKEIAAFIGKDRCLEIGAGTGLWAYLLTLEGVNMVATDNKCEHDLLKDEIDHVWRHDPSDSFLVKIGLDTSIANYTRREFTDVKCMDALDAIKMYSDYECLMVCWGRVCDYDTFKGNKIVFIGESEGGCTVPPPDESEWELHKHIKIPKWAGMNDFLALYIHKS